MWIIPNLRNGPRVTSQGIDSFQNDHETSTRPITKFHTSLWFTTRQTHFKNTANQNKQGANYLLFQITVTVINHYIASAIWGVSYRPHVTIIQLPNIPPICIEFKKIKRVCLAKDAPIFNLLLFLFHFLSLANYFERKLLFCQYDVWQTKQFKEMLARIHYEWNLLKLEGGIHSLR